MRKTLPWSESCFVCGFRNPVGLRLKFQLQDGKLCMPLALPAVFEGYPGHLHGGVLSAVLDEAAGWACTVKTGKLYFTVELSVKFRAPAPGGKKLLLEAECLSASGRKARGWAAIKRPEDGKVLVEATGVYVAIPKELQEKVVPRLLTPHGPASPEDLAGVAD